MDELKIPPSSEEVGEKAESVSSAPNHGNKIDAAPVIDAGIDSGCGHWTGDGYEVKFVKQ